MVRRLPGGWIRRADGRAAVVPGTSGNSVYDPRFRSWYVAAASGPKDVVIVIDVSGSMGINGRMGIAQAAAKKVLDTFTESDS